MEYEINFPILSVNNEVAVHKLLLHPLHLTMLISAHLVQLIHAHQANGIS